MRRSLLSLLFAIILFGANAQEMATIEYISADLNELINQEAKVEVLADGFQFTEGPLWVKKENMLLFSDVPGNIVYKWTESGGKEVYLNPGGYTSTESRGGFMGPNGLTLTNDGKLLICQHGDQRIAIMEAPLDAPAVNYATFVGEYQGKKLNSPNDLFLTRKGDLYFTDPAYGFEKGPDDPKKELSFNGVYKRTKDGEVVLLLDSIEQPNGIAIFPGGERLLVANSNPQKKRWYVYDIGSDGNLTGGKIFYDASNDAGMGLCDGFKIDRKGNVFATGPGGIYIFSDQGEILGKIRLNGVTAANCALSPDDKTLYITAQQYLLRLKMR